jgi:hypothetical protein
MLFGTVARQVVLYPSVKFLLLKNILFKYCPISFPLFDNGVT